jgi:hypothetical protein
MPTAAHTADAPVLANGIVDNDLAVTFTDAALNG